MSRKKRRNEVAVATSAGDGELAEQTPRGTLMSRVATAMVSYHPKPMSVPVIDPEFEELSVVPRVAEVCRISAARVLYAVSPGGWLQVWWKLCLACLGGILPVVMVLYLAGCSLTYLLEPVELTTLALQRIALHLVSIAGLAASVVILYAFCRIVLKGTGMIVKSSLVTGMFTVVVLVVFLVVGVAYGLGWLEAQCPLIFSWLKWFFSG